MKVETGDGSNIKIRVITFTQIMIIIKMEILEKHQNMHIKGSSHERKITRFIGDFSWLSLCPQAPKNILGGLPLGAIL